MSTVKNFLNIFYYVFFFQAEDGIRDLVRSRGLGDVYKRQELSCAMMITGFSFSRVNVFSNGVNNRTARKNTRIPRKAKSALRNHGWIESNALSFL